MMRNNAVTNQKMKCGNCNTRGMKVRTTGGIGLKKHSFRCTDCGHHTVRQNGETTVISEGNTRHGEPRTANA